MDIESALKTIGDWISKETESRKYPKSELLELSESLQALKSEIARQSAEDKNVPTSEEVAEAIEWQESEKESAQNDWERAGAEWRMEPGAQEQHDERMASFDLAIQALRQMAPSK